MSDDQKARYEKQVRLLMTILPLVMKDARLALKGGTALNLFVRDLPRFSVDIDLTYLPIEPRAETIGTLNNLLAAAAGDIRKAIRKSNVTPSRPFDSGREIKLMVEVDDVVVKVEPNYILRGSVFPSSVRDLCQSSRERFAATASVNVMSFADLYGGKICAALDRQHPRDLFDIRILLRHEGLTDEVRQAFLVYLMCHNRPMNELLNPRWQDVAKVFSNEFLGMSNEVVRLDDLIAARDTLLATLRTTITNSEKSFLLDFKAGRPDWGHFPFPQVQHFPAIKWKQRNLALMTVAKHAAALRKLQEALDLH